MQKTKEIFEHVNQDKLKRMLAIKQLYYNGELSQQAAKKRMKNEAGSISPEEFVAAEQLLKDEDPDECRNEDVSKMLDIFEGLIPDNEHQLPFGHPIDAYKRENQKIKELLIKGDIMLQKPLIIKTWLSLMKQILEYKVHFSRKQNQLYSALERKGFDRPSTTMWTYDDIILDEMNKAMEHLKNKETSLFTEAYKTMIADLRDLMDKEELILYPTSLKLISDAEFEDMKSGDCEIGFCLIDMPEYKKSSETTQKEVSSDNLIGDLASLLAKHGYETDKSGSSKILDVAEGKLTLEQINLLFRHMPVDISYVDENELVAFYTDTPHRVFPRSKGVIGREVKNCHPPKSVHLVEEIIDKFRNGEQNSVDFWINKPDTFIYILYVAVRDENGKFRGVIEMMQDCTHIRRLNGSRTLLTWEDEQNQSKRNQPKILKEKTNNEKIDTLTPDTKLESLIKKYPQLKDDLPDINPKFKILNTPMAKVILPIATVKMMSECSEMALNELIIKLKELISSYKDQT